MKDTTKGYLLGALSAASYGINPLAVNLYNDGFNTDSVLFYRYALAIVFIGILMLLQGESFKINRKETLQLLFMGILMSISSISLFESYNYIDVSIASTLLFVYPALVTIIMMLFYKERPSISIILALLGVGLGITLLNKGEVSSSQNIFGVSIVILSSLTYAIYIVMTQKSSTLRNLSSLKLSFYALTFGILLFVARMICGNELYPLTNMSHYGYVITLALFPTLISLTAMAKAIKYVGPTPTAIMGALEPVTAVILGIIILGERPSIWAYIGMIIIVASITLIITSKNKTT
jgi:drug/metabolite transporter (DMT)-like permease